MEKGIRISRDMEGEWKCYKKWVVGHKILSVYL